MSANRPDNDTLSSSTAGSGGGTTGATGSTGGTSAGAATGGATSGGGSTGLATTGAGSSAGSPSSGSSAGAGAATGVAAQAKEYGQKVADAASQAKDYLSERASVVGDKIQDLRNKDYQQIAEEAKDYARQNPGQALLISAAAGFLIGLLVRGGRR